MIGETAEIGDNVTIYPCVTLGGTKPTNGVGGKRHPTLRTMSLLARVRRSWGRSWLEARARIGANAVVTENVPEGATMVGVKARSTLIAADTWQQDFMPYGTPCSERFDPATQKLELLQCEMETLQKRLAALLEERDAEAAKQSSGRKRSKKSA